MSLKWKLISLLVVVVSILTGKYVLLDMPIASGTQVGVLKKMSHQGAVIKSWNGYLEVDGESPTRFHFSVRNDQFARELLEMLEQEPLLEIEYQEFRYGWPRKTPISVSGWKLLDKEKIASYAHKEFSPANRELVRYIGRTLFCSLLGSLYQDQELYQRVKDYIKEANPFLYQQYNGCNK